MARKTIADEIIEGLKDFEDSEGSYIVMYDFARVDGKSIHHSFWRNLNRLFEKLGDGRRVQLSVMECRMLHTAMAVKALAERFKARDVAIYRIEKLDPKGKIIRMTEEKQVGFWIDMDDGGRTEFSKKRCIASVEEMIDALTEYKKGLEEIDHE